MLLKLNTDEIMKKGTLIGKGREADVFYWGNNQVLKLFQEGTSKNYIEFEFNLGKLVEKYYKFAPKVFEVLKIDNRGGILYEYINGKPMTEIILENPLKIRKFAKTFAKLHVEMHKHRINEIRKQKDYFEKRIRNENLLTSFQKDIIIKYLRNLNHDSILCHGDFHLENVLVTKNGFFVIDWSVLTAGNRYADIARTLYILKHSHDSSASQRSSFLNFIIKFFRFYFVNKYLRSYKRLTKLSLKQVKKWSLVIYAIRLGEGILEEQEFLLSAIDNDINKLTKNKTNI